ncbi:hypothetical protein B7P43_G15223, partial [Cryptotermes secundus]
LAGSGGLSCTDRQAILEAHNKARQTVALGRVPGQPAASRMLEMNGLQVPHFGTYTAQQFVPLVLELSVSNYGLQVPHFGTYTAQQFVLLVSELSVSNYGLQVPQFGTYRAQQFVLLVLELSVSNYGLQVPHFGTYTAQQFVLLVLERSVWDEELAAVAQRWADKCTLAHDGARDVSRFPVGQNIAVTWTTRTNAGAAPDFRRQIMGWFNEVRQYGFYSPFRKGTGHYSQVGITIILQL